MKTQNIIATFVVAVALAFAGNTQAREAGGTNEGNGELQNRYLAQSCVEYLSDERPDEAKAVIQDICNIISQ